MPCWRALPIPIRAPACVKKSPRSAFITTVVSRSSEAIRIAISTHGAAKPGQTIADIVKAQNLDELDAVFDIIIADKGSSCILVRCMSEDNVRTIASEPTATVGSDGPCVSPYGVTGQGKPHPRLYGTFPRLIVRYAWDLGLLALPQAIHKMTGMVATASRTWVFCASTDVVVFDAAEVIDRATFDKPHTYSLAIDAVIVNGRLVIDGDTHTEARPGRLLRRYGAELR